MYAIYPKVLADHEGTRGVVEHAMVWCDDYEIAKSIAVFESNYANLYYGLFVVPSGKKPSVITFTDGVYIRDTKEKYETENRLLSWMLACEYSECTDKQPA